MYITKANPTGFYEWVVDAGNLFSITDSRTDSIGKIETEVQLSELMDKLSYRERKIVLLHSKSDKTFKQIGKALDISESQVSRIYKKAIDKMKSSLN